MQITICDYCSVKPAKKLVVEARRFEELDMCLDCLLRFTNHLLRLVRGTRNLGIIEEALEGMGDKQEA